MTAEFIEPEAADSRRTRVEALYRQYNQALRRLLARRRLKPEEVADVVQETYYRIHRASDVNAIRNPKAFLFRVASNVWFNQRKQQSRSIQNDALDIDGVEVESEEPSPFRYLQGQQELAIVRAALEELAPRCRAAFVMNRFENMTFRQIAIELGVSASMIEKYVSHAISHMRGRLNEDRAAKNREAAPVTSLSKRRST